MIASTCCLVFQSTLPARGATFGSDEWVIIGAISIHAPRTGSDGSFFYKNARQREISIHAPRTGSDVEFCVVNDIPTISIHAPRTGSDAQRRRVRGGGIVFQSTLPARGATAKVVLRATTSESDFNPRSPHGERHGLQRVQKCSRNFNPRSPHGERRRLTA